MLQIPREYVNSMCEVKTLENDLVATGLLTEIEEEFVQITEKNSPLPLVTFGTMLKVNVFNANLGFRVIIGTVLSTSVKFLKLVEVSSLLDYERRNFFRIETDMNAFYIEMYEDGSFAEIAPIVVRDLSLGGALLECEGFEFERDQVIWVRVRLGHIFCNLKCHICRLIETNRQVRYGCEFEDVSEGQTDALCSYVFQRQRERINKKRNDY